MARRIVKASEGKIAPGPAGRRKIVRDAETGAFKGVAAEVMKKAQASGLRDEKGSRITGRVSKALIERAKLRTGVKENTRLIELALANLALDDNFTEAFKSVRGAVAPDIKLGF